MRGPTERSGTSLSRRDFVTGVVSSIGAGGLQFPFPASASSPFAWHSLKIGAGGFITGLSIADDETLVVRTDTYGAWKWNGKTTPPAADSGALGAWQQLLTTTGMPAPFSENAQHYAFGVFEIMVAPSNSEIMYMVFPVFPNSAGNGVTPPCGIYKSVNGGQNWTQAPFRPVPFSKANANGPDSGRTWGNKMAIHPTNPDVVFVGFESDVGAFCTLDGGDSWNRLLNLPIPVLGGIGSWGWAFNPSNPNTLYAWSDGRGIYASKNVDLGASSAWTQINEGSGPKKVYRCDISLNGKYYVVDGEGGDLWSYDGRQWTHEILGANPHTVFGVACDPSTPNHVIAADGRGSLNENNGSSWSGWSNISNDFADVPWQGTAGFSTNTVGLAFSRTNPGKLYINGENGFFSTKLTSAISKRTVVNWKSQFAGQEQLVGNVIICPTSNRPILGGWDHAIFAPDLARYPSTFGPVADAGLNSCWSLDYAKFKNTEFVVAICDGVPYGGLGVQRSGWSTDGGRTWSLFGSHGTILPSGVWISGSGNGGGCIAVSSPSNFIWASNGGVAPQYTLDGGRNWAPISLPGISSFSGFMSIHGIITCIQVIADTVAQNTFYLWYNNQGIFKTINGGAKWTKISSNAPTVYAMGAVPGKAGRFWAWNGSGGVAGLQQPGGSYPPNQAQVYYVAELEGSARITQVNNAINFDCMGFGAPAQGQSYPAVYGIGWTTYQSKTTLTVGSGTKLITVPSGLRTTFIPGSPCAIQQLFGSAGPMVGTIVSYNSATGHLVTSVDYTSGQATASNWVVGVWGVWQNTGGESATPVWNQIGPWPNDSFDTARSICGDPSVFGQIYVALGGSGAAMRK